MNLSACGVTQTVKLAFPLYIEVGMDSAKAKAMLQSLPTMDYTFAVGIQYLSMKNKPGVVNYSSSTQAVMLPNHQCVMLLHAVEMEGPYEEMKFGDHVTLYGTRKTGRSEVEAISVGLPIIGYFGGKTVWYSYPKWHPQRLNLAGYRWPMFVMWIIVMIVSVFIIYRMVRCLFASSVDFLPTAHK